MTDPKELPPRSWQDAAGYWMKFGLSRQHANGLANAGFGSMEDMKAASDHKLSVIQNVGTAGMVAIYRLIDRKPPRTLRTAAERRLTFEVEWRARAGDERFDQLIDDIVEVAGGDLEKVNGHAAQALWNIARNRRARSTS